MSNGECQYVADARHLLISTPCTCPVSAVLRDLAGPRAVQDKANAYIAASESKVLDLSRSELGTLLRLPAALTRFRATGIRMMNLSYNSITSLAPLAGDILPNLEGKRVYGSTLSRRYT